MTFEEALQINKSTPITKLNFNELEDSFIKLPEKLVEFQHLEVLITGKKISVGKDIKKLVALKRLTELTVNKYRLKTFPLCIMEMASLTYLNISGNKLAELPQVLEENSRLSYLNLMGCMGLQRIYGFPPNLTYLAIGDSGLQKIPEQVYKLKKLNKLVATNMDLKILPIEICTMTSLMSLYLSQNKLTDLPFELKNLKRLDEIVLMENQFKVFPQVLTEIECMEIIRMPKNRLTSLPPSVSKLINITELDFRDNEFIEFPKVILSLHKLEKLDLGNLFIHDPTRGFGFNAIRTIPEEIIKLDNLREFSLRQNPIENVPKEIISGGFAAIKNYFQSKLEADTEEFLFEAKMVIVGRGNVGKTVLTRRLTDPAYELQESDTTEGICVLRNPFYTKLKIDGHDINFKLNIWDFGGQEKYDATHQLFITKRSIYLFLTEAREESNYMDFYFWLNTIQLFSDNSPVIIVLSKIDERRKSLPESVYKLQFTNIVDFVDVSCAKGYEGTISSLLSSIDKSIELLPQTKLKLSNRWIEIRNELEELSLTLDYISYQEYLEICHRHKLDKVRANFLSQFLNDLGAIVHHQQDVLLKEIVFLNTDWCVDGMYKILDNQDISDNGGKFTSDDLEKVWFEDRFKYKKAELVKLLHQYHLCFELRDGTGYIAPDLLPPDRRDDLIWDRSYNLQFQYDYDFMPAGILSRFIVKSHGFIKDSQYWKHGVVLEHEGTLALVEEDYIKGKLKISLKGKNKKGMLSAIRMYIKEVHSDFDKSGKLNYKEMVPCNCAECNKANNPHFYEFGVLKRFEEKGKYKIACNKSAEDVSVKSLIDDVQLENKKVSLQTNEELKLFVMNIIDTVLEKEITLKGNNVIFWRDQHFKIPKNETEIHPYIATTLDHYCKFNGINVSREVVEANGSVDILMSTRNEDNKLLKVCIEIKKAHHQDVVKSISTQLPIYMESAGTDAGIYLIIWLKNDHHPYPAKFQTPLDLQLAIEGKNPAKNGISVKMLNCCKVDSPSKIKN